MFRSLSRKRRFGFTLVEVLVTTVVIGVLAAVVLPALARQTSAADPARISSDLNNIKMGIEVFSQNMRPDYPGDLEDLVNSPSTTDDALDGSAYAASTENWKGPYVAQTIAANFGSPAGNSGWAAGASGHFENQLQTCDLAAAVACDDVGTVSPFVTIRLNELTQNEAESTDLMLDGETNSSTGMFRFVISGSDFFGYYYTIPYTP